MERMVVTDDGARLWSTGPSDPTAGLPVVLSHGGPGLWDEGGDLVADMVDGLASVVRWDQRGGGRSAGSRRPFSIARFVADLDAVRAAWAFERCVVAGHSWGAGLSLRYALAHPDRTVGLVYLSGTDLGWRSTHRATYRAERLRRLGSDRARWEALEPEADAGTLAEEDREEFALLAWSTDFFAGGDRERAKELTRRFGWWRFPVAFDVNAVINAESKAEDEAMLRAACAQLKGVPALVVHGLEDPRPAAGPQALAEVLPVASFVGLPGVGHVPWAEGPELLRAALREFLAGGLG
jgi:proline iminopeptidase